MATNEMEAFISHNRAACLTVLIGNQTVMFYIDARLLGDMTHSTSRSIFMHNFFMF